MQKAVGFALSLLIIIGLLAPLISDSLVTAVTEGIIKLNSVSFAFGWSATAGDAWLISNEIILLNNKALIQPPVSAISGDAGQAQINAFNVYLNNIDFSFGWSNTQDSYGSSSTMATGSLQVFSNKGLTQLPVVPTSGDAGTQQQNDGLIYLNNIDYSFGWGSQNSKYRPSSTITTGSSLFLNGNGTKQPINNIISGDAGQEQQNKAFIYLNSVGFSYGWTAYQGDVYSGSGTALFGPETSLRRGLSPWGESTPTPTPTASPTAAPTPTPTVTPTSTPSATPTTTPAITPTPSPSITPTPTPTPLPPSPTPASTVSPTPKPPTPSPTIQPTPTPTITPTSTPIPTSIPTIQPTPTHTPQPTPVPSTNAITTLWDPVKNSYNSQNPPSVWSPGGNCYGYSSTAVLYFNHYNLKDTSYPYFPTQTSQASYTSNLNFPGISNGKVSNLNNAFLAITFHQIYDPQNSKENWTKAIADEKQQFDKLLTSLKNGKPAVLGLGNSSTPRHAVVAFEAVTISQNLYSISIYDPNYPETKQSATFDATSGNFLYTKSGGYDKFTVIIPSVISNSWGSGWWNLFGLSWWWSDWLTQSIPGYTIVISEKPVTIESNGARDYFTTVGNSGSFVNGIPGSCGITEGNMQVYAIPPGVQFNVIDPTTTTSTIFIGTVETINGQPSGKGYLVYGSSSGGALNFTVTSSDSSVAVHSANTAINANLAIFSANQENINIFQATDIPIDTMQIANFTVSDWQSLNSTSQAPVSLRLVNADDSGASYDLANGQQGLNKQNNFMGGLQVTILFGVVIVIIAIALALMTKRRRKKH